MREKFIAWKNWLLQSDVPVRMRLFDIIVIAAIIACAIGGGITLASGQLLSGIGCILCMLFLIWLIWYCKHTGQYDRCGIIIVAFVCIALFPGMYFVSGALESGMPSWWMLGLLFTFLILQGKAFWILLVLQICEQLIVIVLSYFHPELVFGRMDRAGYYLDAAQSYLIVALVVGTIIKFQVGIYDRAQKSMQEQNEQLEAQAKALEEQKAQLIEANEIANAASNAKSDFLASMSHEIRTPINAVMGLGEMIQRETTEDVVAEHMTELLRSADLLKSLINDILDFSKIESQKMELVCVDYEIILLAQDLEQLIAERADKKGLQLIVQVDENLPSKLHGDDMRIKQVVLNLLTNAVKYTETGSVTLSFALESGSDMGVELRISVKDTGIGVKDEDKEKLFNSFQRLDETKNRYIEGTGLGLNIVKGFVDLMGGRIELESEYGKGSTFSIVISQMIVDPTPVGKYRGAKKRARRKNAYQPSFLAPNARVLSVDDNAVNRTVFAGLLKETKIQIDNAESGFECLELASKVKYDMIFMDHMMPEMDGYETFIKLREKADGPNYDTPVIALTANALAETKQLFMDSGFADYMTKPVKGEQLEEMILRYLPPEKVEKK